MYFGMDPSDADLCANGPGTPGCPKELNMNGLKEFLRSFPREEQQTHATEAALIYVGVVLILYVALVAMFVSGSFRRLIGGRRSSTGKRHLMNMNPDGKAVPELAEHYPSPIDGAVKV